MKFIAKRSAELAEALLAAQAQRFLDQQDLLGDAVDAEIQHGPAGLVEAHARADRAEALAAHEYDDGLVWHEPEYAGILAALEPQGRAFTRTELEKLEQLLGDDADKPNNSTQAAPQKRRRA